jgi:phosphoglycolate phosphatase-like HAD superfamily hydrolase
MATFDALQLRSWEYQIQRRQVAFIDQLPTGITRWLVPHGDHNLVAEYDPGDRRIRGILDEAWAAYFQRYRRREAARLRKLRDLIDEYFDGAIRDGRQHEATGVLRTNLEEAIRNYGEASRMEAWREIVFGKDATWIP